MAITINGTGTITGISVGGLNDSIITSAELANGAVTAAKIDSLPSGSILQVVQTAKTDTYSESVGLGAVSSTVMSASITPASTSNKILVMFNGTVSHGNIANTYVILYEDGSIVSGAVGDAAGNRLRISSGQGMHANSVPTSQSFTYLHSPGVTTELTYQIRLAHASGETRTVYMNYNANGDGDQVYVGRAASFLTLMEIAG